MQRIRSIFVLIMTILVVVACILVVIQNASPVRVSFVNLTSDEISLGLLMILVFASGALFTVMLNITWYTGVLLRHRRLNKALQQSLKRVEHIRQP